MTQINAGSYQTDSLHDENARLEGENAKLRERASTLAGWCIKYCREADLAKGREAYLSHLLDLAHASNKTTRARLADAEEATRFAIGLLNAAQKDLDAARNRFGGGVGRDEIRVNRLRAAMDPATSL